MKPFPHIAAAILFACAAITMPGTACAQERDIVRELNEAAAERKKQGIDDNADPFDIATYLRGKLFQMSLNGYPREKMDFTRLTPAEAGIVRDAYFGKIRAHALMDNLARRCEQFKSWEASEPAKHMGEPVKRQRLTRAQVIEDAKQMIPPSEAGGVAATVDKMYELPQMQQVPCERANYENAHMMSMVLSDAYIFYRKAGIDRTEVKDFESASAQDAFAKLDKAVTFKHCPRFGACTAGYDLIVSKPGPDGKPQNTIKMVEAVKLDACKVTFALKPLNRDRMEMVAQGLWTIPPEAKPSEYVLDLNNLKGVRQWHTPNSDSLYRLTGEFGDGVKELTLMMRYISQPLVGALEKLRTTCAG